MFGVGDSDEHLIKNKPKHHLSMWLLLDSWIWLSIKCCVKCAFEKDIDHWIESSQLTSYMETHQKFGTREKPKIYTSLFSIRTARDSEVWRFGDHTYYLLYIL